MKKVIYLVSILLMISTFGFAQKSNVSKARNKALSETPDFKGAEELIQAALTNDETKNEPSTYVTAGIVYEEDANNEYKKMQKADVIKMGEDAMSAYKYYVKAYDMEAVPNAKGKIKIRDKNKITESMLNLYNKMFLVNYGIQNYQNKNYKTACEAFDTHTSIPDLPIFDGSRNKPVKDSTYYQICYYSGLCASLDSNVDLAIKKFTYLKDKGYDEDHVYQYLYDLYSQKKDTANFVQILKEGKDKFPKDFFFLGNLINFYMFNNQGAKADGLLDEAIVRDPNNAQYYNVKGSIKELENQLDSALFYYDKAIALAPDDEAGYVNKGRIYYNEAVAADQKAETIKDIKQYNAEKSNVYDMFKKSLPYFEKAYKINPDDTDNMKTLRSLYYRFQQKEPQYQEKYNEINSKL